MTDSQKIDILMIRQTMILELMPLMPAFMAATTRKHSTQEWRKVRRQYIDTVKKYEKQIDEYINNIASEQARVS